MLARAMGLALTATPLSATEAQAYGLIWKSYPDSALLPAAQELAKHLASGPTKALAATKMMMQQAATNDLNTQLDLEATTQKSCAQSQDYAEGVLAFLEKRGANFSGK